MTTHDARFNGELGESEVKEPVSFSLGLHRCVGNAELYRRLLDRFLTTRLTVPDDIRSLWLGGDLTDSAMMAHSMISTAGTLGATALSEAARALQQALKQEPARVEECLSVFGREHALAIASIRKHVGG
ncbi:Hpt domain-containing protein [Paucibacter sp. R3-3]|uniref:Hpt domain-containing protein n=1 Tax=Roseateles agri TaxID=3098619 RepID=A0ABU5DJN7_9BURK|nr:Hpt domain-containing protein [Paucibacter sp. R3-3]MDY0746510.1 Hpt domain-containing protein [Paucibacter sp. R3-3]